MDYTKGILSRWIEVIGGTLGNLKAYLKLNHLKNISMFLVA